MRGFKAVVAAFVVAAACMTFLPGLRGQTASCPDTCGNCADSYYVTISDYPDTGEDLTVGWHRDSGEACEWAFAGSNQMVFASNLRCHNGEWAFTLTCYKVNQYSSGRDAIRNHVETATATDYARDGSGSGDCPPGTYARSSGDEFPASVSVQPYDEDEPDVAECTYPTSTTAYYAYIPKFCCEVPEEERSYSSRVKYLWVSYLEEYTFSETVRSDCNTDDNGACSSWALGPGGDMFWTFALQEQTCPDMGYVKYRRLADPCELQGTYALYDGDGNCTDSPPAYVWVNAGILDPSGDECDPD